MTQAAISEAEIWLVVATASEDVSLVVLEEVSELTVHTWVFLSGQVLAKWPCLPHSKQWPFSQY